MDQVSINPPGVAGPILDSTGSPGEAGQVLVSRGCELGPVWLDPGAELPPGPDPEPITPEVPPVEPDPEPITPEVPPVEPDPEPITPEVPPVEPDPEPEPEPVELVLTLERIEPGTTKAHFHLENATVPVTYDFGDGLTHVPAGADTAHTYAGAGIYTVSVVDAAAAEATLEIGVPPETLPALFDPTGHTVAEVTEYAATASPEELLRIYEAEQNGKNRASALAAIEREMTEAG